MRFKLRTMCVCILILFVALHCLLGWQSYDDTILNNWLLAFGDPTNNNSSITSGSSSSSNLQNIISCPSYEFQSRSSSQYDEALPFYKLWNETKTYVKSHQLTYLSNEELEFHRDKVSQIETKGIPGMILECGVAKAGSALTLAAIKNQDRCLHLFDTFEGMPEPSQEKDGDDVHARYKVIQDNKQKCLNGEIEECDESYYGNMKDLLTFDQNHFQQAGLDLNEHHVFFHKGLFQDTVWPAGPVAYVHLDGDWYESTMGMLQRILPFLSVGGFVVLDDVFHYSGAKFAFLDYFQLDSSWLDRAKKECVRERQEDGTRYLIFIDIKAGAQRLGLDDNGHNLTACPFVKPKGQELDPKETKDISSSPNIKKGIVSAGGVDWTIIKAKEGH